MQCVYIACILKEVIIYIKTYINLIIDIFNDEDNIYKKLFIMRGFVILAKTISADLHFMNYIYTSIFD